MKSLFFLAVLLQTVFANEVGGSLRNKAVSAQERYSNSLGRKKPSNGLDTPNGGKKDDTHSESDSRTKGAVAKAGTGAKGNKKVDKTTESSGVKGEKIVDTNEPSQNKKGKNEAETNEPSQNKKVNVGRNNKHQGGSGVKGTKKDDTTVTNNSSTEHGPNKKGNHENQNKRQGSGGVKGTKKDDAYYETEAETETEPLYYYYLYYNEGDEQFDDLQLDVQTRSRGRKKPVTAEERYPKTIQQNQGNRRKKPKPASAEERYPTTIEQPQGNTKGNTNEQTVHIEYTMDLGDAKTDSSNRPKNRTKGLGKKKGGRKKNESNGDKKKDSSNNEKQPTKKDQDEENDSDFSKAPPHPDMAFNHDISSNFRFNKIGIEHETSLKYPLSMQDTRWLRSSSKAVSVIHPEDCADDCSLEGNVEAALPPAAGVTVYLENLIRLVGGPPTHYGDNDDVFWDELREVIAVREQRLAGAAPDTAMPIPELWSEWNLHEIAAAVHNEFPGSHHILLMEELMLGEQRVTVNRTIIPSYRYDFVRGAVMLSRLTSYAIQAIAGFNFGIKWLTGRARPEEVVWDIVLKQRQEQFSSTTGIEGTDIEEIDTEQLLIPGDIYQAIMSMNLQSPEQFTAYPEGSPMHPSWPAMHAAASAASVWLPLVLDDMPMSLVCEIRKLDFAVSYARTVAGVHYPSDNTAGLKLGQEILTHGLPHYLAESYGADPNVIAERLEKQRFEWDDFMKSECNDMTNQ
eukprot:CAMPEP_0194215246 /NCGR_PEP_ID=MMETSP0156-20130528/16912_1 /TAXON_ID=33649 /ORGANISM="Thalassionema nitzschioides, Strain L26-B" /LENGTH=737 /DNA_ID=CAMNT_0038943713 /DNA_START=23 /DNA_END=2236 /DNA_ORIENTATION=+